MGGDVESQADDVYNGILGEIGLEYIEGEGVIIIHKFLCGVVCTKGQYCIV